MTDRDLKFYTIRKSEPVRFSQAPNGLILVGDGLYLKMNDSTRVAIPVGGVRPGVPCNPDTIVTPVEIRLTSWMDLYIKSKATVEPKVEVAIESVFKGMEAMMDGLSDIGERIAKAMEEPEPLIYEVWMDHWTFQNGSTTPTPTGIVTKLGEAKAKTFELACYEVCRIDPASYHVYNGKPMFGLSYLYPTMSSAEAGRPRN